MTRPIHPAFVVFYFESYIGVIIGPKPFARPKSNHLNPFSSSQVGSHLKRHVFQEVCGAVVSLVLIATASVDPEAHLSEVRGEERHPNTIKPLKSLNNTYKYGYTENYVGIIKESVCVRMYCASAESRVL